MSASASSGGTPIRGPWAGSSGAGEGFLEGDVAAEDVAGLGLDSGLLLLAHSAELARAARVEAQPDSGAQRSGSRPPAGCAGLAALERRDGREERLPCYRWCRATKTVGCSRRSRRPADEHGDPVGQVATTEIVRDRRRRRRPASPGGRQEVEDWRP